MTDDSDSSSIERELKFRSADLNALRDRLIDAEAERVSPSAKEENWLLDRGDELFRSGCLLRVRSEGGGAKLTFKGPSRMEAGVKIRKELELDIDDPARALQLFEALGFRVARRYEKYRETWRLGAVLICLDRTPIGNFVEFEGVGGETVARRLGLELETAEEHNYLELYQEHRRSHPDSPADMVFD